MSLLSKMNKKTEEKRVGNNHPLLSMGMSRNLQDAYLDEIVFASFVDDEQIDESERAYLAKVGLALGIPNGEVEETINAFVAADSDGKIVRAMESAKTLAGSGLANILLCEFSLVWTSHGHDLSELDECRRRVAEWMDVKGFDYDEKFFAVFDEVSAKVKNDPTAVYALYDYLDDNVIRYLFADIFEIERIFAEKRDAENRAVLPHPLKAVLDDAQKACYLSAVRRAVNETSDNAPTKIQQKGLRHLAVALGMKDAGAATEEKEIALSLDSAMRSLAFFRYCDMARLFAMDGRPAFSAAQKQALEEVATSFKLVPEDVAFLKEYSAYLGNGKEPDVAEVVRAAQCSIRFPDGFIRYFTSNMKPIVLAGGDTPAGVSYQIVDGHYRLEKTLTIGEQTRLVIKNAVIDFAPEAEIVLKDRCTTEISDSTFNGEKADDTNIINGEPFFSVSSNVRFERCRFNGAEYRSAILYDGDYYGRIVSLESCQFNKLLGIPRTILGCRTGQRAGTIVCAQSQWNDCKTEGDLFIAQDIDFQACDFVNCTAKGCFATIKGHSGNCIIKHCMFECCNFLSDLNCDNWHGVYEVYNGSIYATFESNCSDKSEGLSRICKASLAQMQKAREEDSTKK